MPVSMPNIIYDESSDLPPQLSSIEWACPSAYGTIFENYRDLGAVADKTSGETIVNPKKPISLMPHKMNKLKEWSISARALRRVIVHTCEDRERYDYKFGSTYDPTYNIYRIWNIKTNNVVCTVKQAGDKVFIRYRQNSHYSPVITNLSGVEINHRILRTLPSERLGIHRGVSEHATRLLSATKEAQLSLRGAMYQEATLEKIRQTNKKGKKC